ncbi:MAG: DUF2167 domain-containing protein [Syntrophobacteraceae bacterium]
MTSKKLLFLLLCVLLSGYSTVNAAEDQSTTPEEFDASLHYQEGRIELPGGMATLDLPDSFRYLDPKDTERVLVQAWGNPDGSGTLGMLFPADMNPFTQDGWGVVITYEEDGHVSDADADSINYDDLLKDMQKGSAENNKERQEQGYQTVDLVGWAAKPYYDKTQHKMYWAKELQFGGDSHHTLNYNIRVLGRKGVLVLNAVSGMDQLGVVEQEMGKVIAFTDFNNGYRYADYDSSTDKEAAYGLAALVAGGVAAKAGLFTKLFALLLAGKKLLIAGAIVGASFLTRLFKKKKESETA